MSPTDIRTEFHRIAADAAPYWIAEIGLNHNGDPELAGELIAAAAGAGASAVKFQLFAVDSFIAADATLGDGPPGSLRDFFRRFELEPAVWRSLAERARELRVDFFCSLFDLPSLDFYRTLEPRLIKISSCDITNRPLLEAARQADLPVLLSTGTADESEVARAVDWLADLPAVLLQCVSSYPAAPGDYNLGVLPAWRERFALPVGISDHCEGNGVTLAAVGLGACVVERHFTLDRSLEGPDHALSLEPDDFRRMVQEGQAAWASCAGDAVKKPVQAEEGARRYGRRSLYLARAVRAGTPVSAEDLIALRPGGGIGPETVSDWVGRNWAGDGKPGQRLTPDMMTE